MIEWLESITSIKAWPGKWEHLGWQEFMSIRGVRNRLTTPCTWLRKPRMEVHRIKGWLLLYLVCSTPLLAFYAAGLSGWIFDYPIGLFFGIFLVLVVPLVLLFLKIRSAPTWNIVGLWVGAGLISLRILYGMLFMERRLQRSEGLTLAAIVSVALAWAIIWTWYFLVSKRVAKTFTWSGRLGGFKGDNWIHRGC